MTATLCSFIVLLIAAVKDLRDRIIPNWMSILIASLSISLPEGPALVGALVAVPLFMAGLLWGGIGGGDIKLVAALGLVFGFWTSLYGLVIALVVMMVYHLMRKLLKKRMDCYYPMVPFLFIGWLVSFLLF